jgi:beta-N-acetylhexosaminidase
MRSLALLCSFLLLALTGAQPASAQGQGAKPGAIGNGASRMAQPQVLPNAIKAPPAPRSKVKSPAIGLEQMIGQMILIGFRGDATGRGWFDDVRSQIHDGKITGVLYLKRNLSDRTTVVAMNRAFAAAAPKGLPPLIAIDQEGGKIERLTRANGFPHTPSAARMAKSHDLADSKAAYGSMARNLARWGFNLNLGPVVDLNTNPNNPIIGRLGRSYSADPEVVSRYGAAFVEAHQAYGLLTALKHFPGHGSSRGDSHDALVDISDTWSPAELEPFRRLIGDGHADLIMSAHVRVAALQAKGETAPVSLSETALAGILRDRFGFKGVIISDDLQMGAIRNGYSLEDAVIGAVNAGTDILIFSNDKFPDPRLPEKAIAILTRAAASDPVLAAKIHNSYRRIQALKTRLASRQRNGLAANRSVRFASVAAGENRKVLTPEIMGAGERDVRLAIPDGLKL